jgi:hypothetical protein
MGQALFWDIFLWVAKIIIPACDSGFTFDAKEASEKARNLRSFGLMG